MDHPSVGKNAPDGKRLDWFIWYFSSVLFGSSNFGHFYVFSCFSSYPFRDKPKRCDDDFLKHCANVCAITWNSWFFLIHSLSSYGHSFVQCRFQKTHFELIRAYHDLVNAYQALMGIIKGRISTYQPHKIHPRTTRKYVHIWKCPALISIQR